MVGKDHNNIYYSTKNISNFKLRVLGQICTFFCNFKTFLFQKINQNTENYGFFLVKLMIF